MVGCCTAHWPGREEVSPHDSRKCRSGRMRSASAAVSSIADANDTLNGTLPNASRKPDEAGKANAGLLP